MIYAIKVLLKEPFHLLRENTGRKFLWLCAKLGGKKRNHPVIINALGRKLRLVDTWSFLWQYHEIFYKQSYHFKTSKTNPLIIDCGSNIGLSILYFKNIYPESRIIAFEADQDVFMTLIDNTRGFDGVEYNQKAIWIHDGGIFLERDFVDGGRITEHSEHAVPSVRLKALLEQYDQIDMLKIDIEGAEYDLIEDCRDVLFKVRCLFVEIHCFAGQRQQLSRVLQTLEGNGFRYFIKNENNQLSPLTGNWVVNSSGMDVQLNLFAIQE